MTYRIYQSEHHVLFVNFMRDSYDSFPKEASYAEALRQGAAQFEARFSLNTYYDHIKEDSLYKGPYIEFKDERYYSMFVLRYS